MNSAEIMSGRNKSTLKISSMAVMFLILLLASGLDTVPLSAKQRSASSVISPGSSSEGNVVPTFVQQPLDTFVTENNHGFFNCSAKFASRIEFICNPPQFLKEFSDHVTNLSHLDNSSGLLSASLRISYEQIASVQGLLSCQCRAFGQNGQNVTSQTARLTPAYIESTFVLGPISEDASYDQTIKRGDKLVIDCASPKGVPEPSVSWMKDGTTVSSASDGRIQIKRNKANISLTIMTAEVEDSGVYYCVANNDAGVRKSVGIDVQVFVDGGWSKWRPWEPDKGCILEDAHLLCGNGTQTLVRYCDNPSPEHGGAWCVGEHRQLNARCSIPCPDGPLPRIICPHSGSHYVNSSDHAIIHWDHPTVESRYNFTVSMTIDSPGVHPPLFPVSEKPFNVTYTVITYDKVVVSCSFNMTVHNVSTCTDEENCHGRVICKDGDACPSTTPPTDTEGKFNITAAVVLAVSFFAVLVVALLTAGFIKTRIHLRSYAMAEKRENLHLEHLLEGESESDLSITQRKGCYYYLPIEPWEKPSELWVRDRERSKTVSGGDDNSIKSPHWPLKNELKRQISDASHISTASEVSRMIWNLSNLPSKADYKHAAWGLVDHNGGLLTIADCGVSLLVPPMAIPEGRTEAIFIALMKEDGDYPSLSERQSLLSPVVVCGPNGIKFSRPVTLTMPQCAAFQEDNAWNMSVYYNESGNGDETDWQKLLEVNSDDPNQSSLVLMEQKACHLMVDHFTDYVLVGESAPGKKAVQSVKILAYFTPPKVNTDCVVRVYCVADTPAALKILHDQEKDRYSGETIDAPKPFNFRDGGGNLKVELVDHQSGWQAVTETQKEIGFRNIWNGIERMHSCTFLFSQQNKNESRFSCRFKVQQSGEDCDEQEVIVATGVQRDLKRGAVLDSAPMQSTKLTRGNNEGVIGGVIGDLACANCGAHRPNRTSSSSSITAFGDHYPHLARKADYRHLSCSSGYSSGMETLQSAFFISQETRSELILMLDPPHHMDWRMLAERLGFEHKHIKWLECRPGSPTETILNWWETSGRRSFPLFALVEILRNMGRDDAAGEIEKILPRETRV